MSAITGSVPADSLTNTEIATAAAIARAKLALEGKKYEQSLESLRIFDSASNAVLPNTAATDDLALVLGTLGTDGHNVETSDAKATTVTQKARFTFILPAEYESEGTIYLTPWAGMKTTVSDTTATVDFSVYAKVLTSGAHGSDICNTAATTINSLTCAAKAFEITATGLAAGDELSVLMTVAITDSATGTAVLGLITNIYWLCQVRG